MITLYQFKLSHYCEKVRWALDYKQLPFTVVNLAPGLHVPVVKRIAGKTSVPVILDHGKCIQDSTTIIDYLDDKYPQKNLTPSSKKDQEMALELEEYFDKEIGVHLRRYFYNTLLHHPKIVIPLLTADLGMVGSNVFKLMFPLIRFLMCKSMRITPEAAQKSLDRLNAAMDKLDTLVKHSDYLVGNKFSRADIAAAALLGPLVKPKNHPMQYPAVAPEPLQTFMEAQKKRPSYKWVEKMYEEHR